MLINELFNSNSEPVIEGAFSNSDRAVASAIIRRILLQRTDLLSKYGPERVGAAVDDVADFVGDTDEIGSSDVSGWVRHVEQMLGNMEQGVAENNDSYKPEPYDEFASDTYGDDNPEDEPGVAEGLEQPKEAFQAIQKLQRFAQDNPDFTLQQLDTLPSRGNPIKPMFANANLAIDTLIQAYKTRKELGNAEFLKQLKDEINYFLTDRTASQDPTTLGDLLTGKLGKINFQQGVAEGRTK
jgi:hypothetical protein